MLCTLQLSIELHHWGICPRGQDHALFPITEISEIESTEILCFIYRYAL